MEDEVRITLAYDGKQKGEQHGKVEAASYGLLSFLLVLGADGLAGNGHDAGEDASEDAAAEHDHGKREAHGGQRAGA